LAGEGGATLLARTQLAGPAWPASRPGWAADRPASPANSAGHPPATKDL